MIVTHLVVFSKEMALRVMKLIVVRLGVIMCVVLLLRTHRVAPRFVSHNNKRNHNNKFVVNITQPVPDVL
jgi:hypothetical protein